MSAPDPLHPEGVSATRAAWAVLEAHRLTTGAVLPCLYCRLPIQADSFDYLSSLQRLVVTLCPHCHRRVTLPTRLWLEWSEQ